MAPELPWHIVNWDMAMGAIHSGPAGRYMAPQAPLPFRQGGVTVLPACRTGRVLRLQLPRRLHPYALSLQAHLCHVRPRPPKPLMRCCECREGPWQASHRRCASTALIAIYVIMLLRCRIRLWGASLTAFAFHLVSASYYTQL